MKSGAPSSAPAMCIYEKDNISVYAKKRCFFKGETVVLPDCKFLCEKAKLFQKVKLQYFLTANFYAKKRSFFKR